MFSTDGLYGVVHHYNSSVLLCRLTLFSSTKLGYQSYKYKSSLSSIPTAVRTFMCTIRLEKDDFLCILFFKLFN